MKKGIYFCSMDSFKRVYGQQEKQQVGELIDIPETLVTCQNWRDHRDLLEAAHVIISTWGGPVLEEEMLKAMPNLELYLYGAGDMSHIMTTEAWDRGIRISSASSANAVPVAEFVLSQIIFSLKRGWDYMRRAKAKEQSLWGRNKSVPGSYGSRIGIVSIGQISRRLITLLKNFDLEVIAACPKTTPEEAENLGVRLTDLETVFKTSDVVTIHLQSNGETKGMINHRLLDLMKPDSTLINTSRGAVINEQELVEFLQERPDVYACIDVTDPEPPDPDSLLLQLPNVVLTPHLAGSMDKESHRLGQFMVDELRRHLNGETLQGEVTPHMLGISQ